jgi:hypothetical protein
MLVWKVVYEYAFESSSGMNRYSIDFKTEGIVLTIGRSLGDVETEIQKSISSQIKMTKLVSADYIGDIINRVIPEA